MKKQSHQHILLRFLMSCILFLIGISAVSAEAKDGPKKDIVSGMEITADGSYVQGPVIAPENYSQANNPSTEIPLGSSLKAYFSFKGPSLKDFMEKVKVENDKLDYYRALFGFNIAF